MKKDTASSTSSTSSREALDQLLLHVEPRLEDFMREEGHLDPTLFTVSPEGLFIYAPGPLNEVSEKDCFAANARLICAAQGVTAVVLALEAWVLEAQPGQRFDRSALPSQSPDRQEVICLLGEARNRVSHQKLFPIMRDSLGRFSCLGQPRVLPPGPAEGRFGHLLPRTPMTQEVRAFAVAMLRARGLVPVKVLGEGTLPAAARN
jgi:hypothetical protein